MSGPDGLRRLLLEGKIVDADALQRGDAAAKQKGLPLERALVQLGLADEAAVWRALAKAHGLKFVDPGKLTPSPEAEGRIPKEQIEQNEALPVMLRDGVLWIAIDDPLKTFVADNLAFFAGCTVQCALMPPGALRSHLRRVVGGGDAPAAAATGARGKGVAAEGDDAPIIRLVSRTIEEALEARASDIHVEPFAGRIRVRYRVDGVLRVAAEPPPHLSSPLISRLTLHAARIVFDHPDGRGQVAYEAPLPKDLRATLNQLRRV